MSDGGKGSSPRPKSVDSNTFADNWDRIFGKKKEIKEEPTYICQWCGADRFKEPCSGDLMNCGIQGVAQ